MDLVVDTGLERVPIEVKLSSTPRPSMAASIEIFRKDLGDRALKGYVVHPGDTRLPLSPDAVAWPFGDF